MPKRQSVKKYPCDEVQGEGSFVVITGVKVREIRKLRKTSKEAGEAYDDFEGGCALMGEHVVKWNWVDDEGNPLPSPKEDPSVVDELTNEETEFLVDLLMGNPKN